MPLPSQMKPKKSTTFAFSGSPSRARLSRWSSSAMGFDPCGRTTTFSGATPRASRSDRMRSLCTESSAACWARARSKSAAVPPGRKPERCPAA